MNDRSLLIITEQLFASKVFIGVLSFVNGAFSLYAVLQSTIAGYYAMALVAVIAFFFNALSLSFCMRSWRKK